MANAILAMRSLGVNLILGVFFLIVMDVIGGWRGVQLMPILMMKIA
jgi:hypothetical protein